MAERLITGFTKSIKFISTDWFREPVPVAVGSSTHQFQFTTSVVHPLRIWVLPYPYITYPLAGVAGLNLVAAGAREALTDPTFAPGVVCGYFTQTNILVNNVPYFRRQLILSTLISTFLHMYTHIIAMLCMNRKLSNCRRFSMCIILTNTHLQYTKYHLTNFYCLFVIYSGNNVSLFICKLTKYIT